MVPGLTAFEDGPQVSGSYAAFCSAYAARKTGVYLLATGHAKDGGESIFGESQHMS